MLSDLVTSAITPRLIAVEIALLSVQALLYFGCEAFQHDHKDVKRSIDDRIPLIPAAAFVYVSWFPLIALFPLALYFLSPREYAVYQIGILISSLGSTALYLAYPTTFESAPSAHNNIHKWHTQKRQGLGGKMMSFEQLKEYIEIGNEIEFTYNNKNYSITYWYPDGTEENRWISFCEFYKETTEVKTAEELWNNVSRDGVTVGQMLSSIDEAQIDIY